MCSERLILFLVWMSIISPEVLPAQQKRAIVASDCATVRYLIDDYAHSPIVINSQGTRVAYLVRSPNLDQNRNDIQLYVRNLPGDSSGSQKLLFGGSVVKHLRWLEDGEHVVVLTNEGGGVGVVNIDVRTGERKVLASGDRDIQEYSVDRNGDTVVFAIDEPADSYVPQPTPQEIAKGYRIPFQRPGVTGFLKRTVFVTKLRDNGEWTKPERVNVQSPFTKQSVTSFPYQIRLYLSLSPNGRFVLITYLEGHQIPEDWKNSPFIRKTLDAGYGGTKITVLQDLSSGETMWPLKTPWASSIPLWSLDGRSFVVVARSPVGSQWEQQDTLNQRVGDEDAHLFWVEPSTGRVEQVASHVATADQPLWWKVNGDLIVRTGPDTISSVSYQSGRWHEKSNFRIPLPNLFRFGGLASDGKYVIGDYQTSTTVPELFMFTVGQKDAEILANLNPQFDSLTIAPMRQIHWKTSTGYDVSGFLFTPPDYIKGVKYPLVIQTKPDQGSFVCDSGENHDPSFAPQPIAHAGMMYLIRTLPTSYRQQDEIDHYPTGYPGGIGEAAFHMDIWDSAVEELDARGLVDRNKVGIIGFSRSGWYTEFILAHSRIRYLAATVTDNLQYSLGEYWLIHSADFIRGSDVMYGGPPYGKTLKTWMDYSISFNTDKIHTPILMEEMGNGVLDNRVNSMPSNLAQNYEVFTALNRLNKPVEMYYYPNEAHQPDRPQARLASLQRNLDWYRFWLQDYQRPHPEDQDQYPRWRKLRELQEIDTATRGDPERR